MTTRTLADACRVFATLDTDRQVKVLMRADGGYGAPATDKVLGYLAGHYPDRYSVLMAALRERGAAA